MALDRRGEEGRCPYCPGNESMTEPAILALVVKDGMLQRLSDSEDTVIDDWSVRVFHNTDPIVATVPTSTYSDKPLYSEPAYGYHQIVVASPEHGQSLSQISVEQWANVLVVIQDRVRWLYTQKSVTYVSIYVNSGAGAGALMSHPHLHIVTFSSIPPVIEMEAEGSHRFMNENGSCPACNISTRILDISKKAHDLVLKDNPEGNKRPGADDESHSGWNVKDSEGSAI
jgi:UDPglucose--hexose-1-phosphate uridylyltransferase